MRQIVAYTACRNWPEMPSIQVLGFVLARNPEMHKTATMTNASARSRLVIVVARLPVAGRPKQRNRVKLPNNAATVTNATFVANVFPHGVVHSVLIAPCMSLHDA